MNAFSHLSIPCVEPDLSGDDALFLIAGEGADGPLAISDLTMGAWRPHQICAELALQLELVLPIRKISKPAIGQKRWVTFASSIAAGIEAESRGRETISDAVTFARLIRQAGEARGGGTFVVVLPPSEETLTWEAICELQILGRELRESSCRLLKVCLDPRPTAGESVAGLLPGILEPQVHRAFVNVFGPHDFIRLNGAFLVNPAARRPSARWVNSDFDRLSSSLGLPSWIRAFAHLHGSIENTDELFLLGASWRAFEEGCSDLALRFAGRAVELARSDVSRAILRSHLMGIQLALGYFSRAGAGDEGNDALPPALRSFLLLAKGWGLTLSGDAPQGRALIRAAQASVGVGDQRLERAYGDNILARAEMLCGDLQAAIKLELTIQQDLTDGTIVDPRLGYVNNINLARLWSKAGDMPRSLVAYDAAFEWARGSRTSAELIYMNFCLARALERAGAGQEARDAWLRAVLHFACCDTAEALPLRYVASILGTDPNDLQRADPGLLAELVAERLLVRLDGGPAEKDLDDDEPVFTAAQSDRRPSLPAGDASILAGPGWSLVQIKGGERLRRLGPARRRLNRALGEALGGLAGGNTYVVDVADGHEVSTAAADVLNLARRWRAGRILRCGVTLALSPATHDALTNAAGFRVGGGVHGLSTTSDGVVIQYKRTKPMVEDADPLGLLAALSAVPDQGVILLRACGQSPRAALDELERLEALGAVEIVLDPGEATVVDLTRALDMAGAQDANERSMRDLTVGQL